MLSVIFRTVIIFFLLLVLMRLLGKRQLGELELSELIVSVLMADLAAAPMQDPDIPLLQGLLPLLVLFLCELLMAFLTVRSVKLRALLCGKPSLLIRNGVILQQEMRHCRFTVDELTEELRNQGIIDLSTVKYAVLETDGALSVIPFAADAPVTARQMGVTTDEPGYPYIIVNEGRILLENLRLCGRNEKWLNGELKRRGAKSPKEVYIMILYENGSIYYAAKKDG